MIPQEFMGAIIANREDDIPRLIAADWLDEHGHHDRAELIRVQCQMHPMTPCHSTREEELFDMLMTPVKRLDPFTINKAGRFCQSEYCVLRRRSEEILSTADKRGVWQWASWSYLPYLTYVLPHTKQGTIYTRGFVSAISCNYLDWMLHGHTITMHQPIEFVCIRNVLISTKAAISSLRRQWPKITFFDYDSPPDFNATHDMRARLFGERKTPAE